jgi:hypothetical protein
MGRIGRSYPRFEEAQRPAALAVENEPSSGLQVIGAIIGILAALGFIGWLVSR